MKEVVSVATMRKSDELTINSGVSGVNLMQRAGKSILDVMLSKFDLKNRVIYIISGKGNNGGDGYALAVELQNKGYDYNVIKLGEVSETSMNFYSKIPDDKFIEFNNTIKLDDKAIIVDCIFGTGFKGKVKEDYRLVIDWINNSNAYVISADIPSGLNGDNGQGDICVKADCTVAIQGLKSGYYLSDGKDNTGEIIPQDIGINMLSDNINIIEDNDIAKLLKIRKHNSNKGSYGRVTIVGGCENYIGACKLANLGLSSLTAGAGLNTLATTKSVINYIGEYVCESTLLSMAESNGKMIFDKVNLDKIISNSAVIVLGMGMGDDHAENNKIIEYILQNFDGKLIIDADGLNSIAKDINKLRNKSCEVALTPHPKEMSRISGKSVEEIMDSPIESAKQFAKKYSCTVLLKGASTVVTDGEKVYLTVNGTPAQSKGGSGDVLSGVISAFAVDNNLIDACWGGSHLCAMACNNLTEDYSVYGVLPSQVAREISRIYKSMDKSR